MVKFMKGALLVGAASLALGSTASAQFDPDVSDAEAKCMQSVSKAGAKFTGAKAKCASKCQTNASKALNPFSECYAPYTPGTAIYKCIINDPLKPGKSAEEKYVAALQKKCDESVNIANDCPECYEAGSGNCTQFADDRMNLNESQIDGFGPGVFCKGQGDAPTPPTKEELACEQNTAKSLVKLVGSINKCYDKCLSNERKSTIPPGSCVAPSPTDPVTQACLGDPIKGVKTKAIASIDKKCALVGSIAIPDCDEANPPADDDYFDGATWTNIVSAVIEGNVPGTYCGSPSGAFLN
jgi:hypothetical protein